MEMFETKVKPHVVIIFGHHSYQEETMYCHNVIRFETPAPNKTIVMSDVLQLDATSTGEDRAIENFKFSKTQNVSRKISVTSRFCSESVNFEADWCYRFLVVRLKSAYNATKT